jgi:hypothetical protein
LGLQQFFLQLNHSPVASFLIYDQPSQVYFPRRLSGDLDPEFRDEDLDAVSKIFSTLSSVVTGSHGRLQIIVLDHAGPGTWEGTESVVLVEEWRGKKLVPEEWIDLQKPEDSGLDAGPEDQRTTEQREGT